MSYFRLIKTGIGVSSRYLGAAYFGYKVGKVTEARIFKNRAKNRANKPKFTSSLGNHKSRFSRLKKKIHNTKWLNKILKPGPIGAASAVILLFTFDKYVVPLIVAERAKSFFDDCFDEKLLGKYKIKPLKVRIEEDDWPINLAQLPEEIGLEEKAEICSLWYEDVSLLDSKAQQIHFILSCIFFLGERLLVDSKLYEGFIGRLIKLLRSGKLSRKLKKYLLMLLRSRGIPISAAVLQLLES